MSINLVSTNRNIDGSTRAAADWSAIKAISGADAASPYPTEGYVSVSIEAIVVIAALLDGAVLTNGERVTTYDFSGEDQGGVMHHEAHVNAFGPSLLQPRQLEALRRHLAPFPHAIAMLDLTIERDLQISLSTTDLMQRSAPHLKAVNWPADEVEINRSSGNMLAMLRDLGLDAYTRKGDSVGEVEIDVFAKAVNDNGHRIDMDPRRLDRFVACARRQQATHVHWA